MIARRSWANKSRFSGSTVLRSLRRQSVRLERICSQGDTGLTRRWTWRQMNHTWVLFQRYRDKAFSFTDCTTFALMTRLRIAAAFAFDIHFRQYGRLVVVP